MLQSFVLFWGKLSGLSVIVLSFVLAVSTSTPLQAHKVPASVDLGWDGNIQFGASATFGETDTSAVSANSKLTYNSRYWEHELTAKYYYSASEALAFRLDSNGEILRDANNKEITDLVRSTTSNRRFFSGESRLFFLPHYYVFIAANIDTDTPADLDMETRQIIGSGYKLYQSKKDYISAEIGFGGRRRLETSQASEQEAIGYFGMRMKRELDENLSLYFDLDTDFGSDDRYTEIETSLSLKLRDPVSLKLQYEAQFNSTLIDPLNTFDDGAQASFTVNLVIDIF